MEIREISKNKPLMIGIVVVCLGVAGVIILNRGSGGSGGLTTLSPTKMMWVVCRNPGCKAEHQVPMKKYYQFMEDYRAKNPSASPLVVPGMPCEKCGQPDSVFEAVKCGGCGLIFEPGGKRDDFADRCPKCGYSQIEKDREEAAAKKGG